MVLLEPESSYFLTNSQLWLLKTAEISAEESGLHFFIFFLSSLWQSREGMKCRGVVFFADFYPYKIFFFVFVFFSYVIISA